MRLPPLLSGAQAEGAKYAQVGDRSPWPLEAAIRRYSKPLADLVARDANEGDTRLLVTSIRSFHYWLRAQRLSWASRHAKVRRTGYRRRQAG